MVQKRKRAKKTPLAWLLLTKQKTRFVVAIAGISFAGILIFLQLGFLGALFEAASKPHRNLNADLVLINPQLQTLFAVKGFSRERLYQTLGFKGVDSVSSLYISTGQWRNPETRLTRAILVWGVDPAQPTFRLPEVNRSLNSLKSIDHVLFDRASRPEYGAISEQFAKSGRVEAQLSDKNMQVSGIFTLGASFAADGNIITSDSTFLQLFKDRQPDRIEVGLINLKIGANLEAVQKELQAGLPNDVRVLTLAEFASVEEKYWAEGTGIGFIFGLGVAVGFIVGIVIVYQILYSDVTEHLPEFATLKAMGYSDRYLLTVLMQEALILAVIGFIPSFFLAFGLYQLTYAATLLPISMKLDRALTVLVLIIIMCSISGSIALRKLYSADPAEIFQ